MDTKVLDYQEYNIHHNKIDRDNLSKKFLEENGKIIQAEGQDTLTSSIS